MAGYPHDDISPEEEARQRALYGPFTEAVRDLVDASIRTLVDGDEIEMAQAEVEAITKKLRTEQLEGGFGVRLRDGRRGRAWGNPVIGLRNPVAPPLEMQHHEHGIHADFHLGAAYEGPPGLVHGGVTSMILDQLLGEAASAAGRPGMTATLTLQYRRGTPLGDLRGEAWVDRTEHHKTWARGWLLADGEVTVDAEGLFVLPRWAREQRERDQSRPDRFE